MSSTAMVWLSVCGDSSRPIIGWLAGLFWTAFSHGQFVGDEEEGETVSLDHGVVRGTGTAGFEVGWMWVSIKMTHPHRNVRDSNKVSTSGEVLITYNFLHFLPDLWHLLALISTQKSKF